MQQSSHSWRARNLTAIVLSGCMSASAFSAELVAHPVSVAVKRGDCDAAIDLVKAGVASNDSQATFLGGRMVDEGVCVVQNAEAATRFFELAASLGSKEASLEYAAKVGLGEGVQQSYERAGELCRAAGIDPQARLSGYSLGYACTLRSVAARLLRVSLPAKAFRPGTGSAVVEFNPSDSGLRVVATPQVERDPDPGIGSHMGHQRVNAQHAIEAAWRSAVAAVPKPDATHLEPRGVELSLDVEMTLENGVAGDRSSRAPNVELPFPVKLINWSKGNGG
jgi:hypothetical protein